MFGAGASESFSPPPTPTQPNVKAATRGRKGCAKMLTEMYMYIYIYTYYRILNSPLKELRGPIVSLKGVYIGP